MGQAIQTSQVSAAMWGCLDLVPFNATVEGMSSPTLKISWRRKVYDLFIATSKIDLKEVKKRAESL